MKFNFQKNQTVAEIYQIFANNGDLEINVLPYNLILKLKIDLCFEVKYENDILKINSYLNYVTKETDDTGYTKNSKLLPNCFIDKKIVFDRSRLNEKFQIIENDGHGMRSSTFQIYCLPEDFVEKTYLHFQKMIQSVLDETDKYELQFNYDYEKFFGTKL